MELSEEERQAVLANRRKITTKDSKAPQGIGTGRPWAQAIIKKKRFIDSVTYIEDEGSD